MDFRTLARYPFAVSFHTTDPDTRAFASLHWDDFEDQVSQFPGSRGITLHLPVRDGSPLSRAVAEAVLRGTMLRRTAEAGMLSLCHGDISLTGNDVLSSPSRLQYAFGGREVALTPAQRAQWLFLTDTAEKEAYLQKLWREASTHSVASEMCRSRSGTRHNRKSR